MLTKEQYQKELLDLKNCMDKVENSPFNNFAKIVTLVLMNIRYEKVAFDLDLKEHPYNLTKNIISDARSMFQLFQGFSFIESDNKSIEKFRSENLIEKHKELWQEIWSRHKEQEFKEFIALKIKRFEVNKLQSLIVGKDCVDFGCGNGATIFGLIEMGARSATGIDFGEKSVAFASEITNQWKLGKKVSFSVDDVARTNLKSNSYDFAVSNGVFHHLPQENIDKALREVARVLRKGGWFWYYVDGKDAISMELWDTSVEILKKVDIMFTEQILKFMNVSRNKMVLIMDGLGATYIHSSYDDVVKQLSICGFGNFKRAIGGTDTDFDHDRIAKDPYGKEKFGEGDIRIVCQLVKK